LALCGVGQSPELLRFLSQRALPTVHVMTFPSPSEMVCVGFDNARAIAQAVRYLLDLGHRRIAMLAGQTAHNDRAAARVNGVRQALQAAGLDLPPHHLVERPYGLAEARDGFRALMAVAPAPTAVLCGNDVLAYGALLEARKMGIDVPKALSVIGFDDLEMSRHIHPTLTTLHVPTEAMWQAAADRLVAALEGTPVTMATEVEVELVVRESTGVVPRRG
jgi:LacI family transcriptional regulator